MSSQPGLRALAWAAAACLLASHAQADDLLEVYYRALELDPTFRAESLDHASSKLTLREAWQGFLPTLNLQFEHIEETQNVVSSDNAVFATGETDFPIDNGLLTLTQPLFRYATITRLAQAKAEVREAEFEFMAAEQDLIVRVADAYLGALAAQDSLAFANAEQAAIQRQLKLAQERVGMGLSTVTDLYDAEARYALAEAEQIEASNVLADSQQALREVIGHVPEYLERLSASVELTEPDPPQVRRWVEQAVSRNLELRARRAAAEAARHEVRRQRANHMPTLDLVATYNTRETQGTVFGGGSEIETTDLLVRFNLPLFEGGRVLTRTRTAKLAHGSIRHQVDRERLRVERATRDAFNGVMSGIRRVRALGQSVRSHASALEVKEEGLKAGLNTTLAVLDAQRDLFLTKRDYAQAQYDYLRSRLRLKQAVGSLDVVDLEAVNRSLGEPPRGLAERRSDVSTVVQRVAQP